MCGITGALWFERTDAIDQSSLERMANSLTHRGPDDQGYFLSPWGSDAVGVTPGVALGFRRLSIIDIEGGHQPMCNEDGSIWIVFNGEIYNYPELRRRLEGTGHRFLSASDTETIIHLYEDLGEECFEHLNGMYAIAIWDRNKRSLLLARDRLGKKPLFYQWHNNLMLFGSELKALLQAPKFRSELSVGAIDHFLTYQYVPHPQSIYSHTKKVPPGHFVRWQWREGPQYCVRQYWRVSWDQEREMTDSDAVRETTELLNDSVRLRMRSDVPLGAFLSGGVDSSLIVALAQSKLKNPIQTFSIGFDEADFDETAYARQVAHWVGSEHHQQRVTADAIEVLDRLVEHYDEPFGDSSALPTWYLCRWTRESVKVALSGDGGDELFAGYDRYRALWLSQWVNRLLPGNFLAARWIQRLPASNRRRSTLRRLQRFCEAFNQPMARRYMNWLHIFPEFLRSDLYREDFIEQLPNEDPFAFLESAWDQIGKRDIISRASLTDLLTYLPCDILNKVDVASMAHSLECRQPFLDYRLVEMAARMPSRFKFGPLASKKILRASFGDLLPRQIWNRKKMGFGIPIDQWFRRELKDLTEKRLLSPDSRCHQYFRLDTLQHILSQHFCGKQNHGYRLWCLLILESWLRRWVG
jgi:asparagine synthase (glutamine-hydrolysing)